MVPLEAIIASCMSHVHSNCFARDLSSPPPHPPKVFLSGYAQNGRNDFLAAALTLNTGHILVRCRSDLRE